MLIYRISQDSLIESKIDDVIHDNDNKYWLIMTPDELDENNEFFRFSFQTVYDCIHNEDAPKLDAYDNYSFGILNIIGPKDSFFSVNELNFYITKNYLIFVSKNYLDIFRELQNEINHRGSLRISTEKILYNLIDKMTLKDYNMLSNLESEISDVEEGVLENLTENENEILDETSITYFVILFNRIERLNRKVGNLRDYVTQIRESYQAQLDIRLNNTMKLFTVLTAVFSPLTLIVGWYGMNFPTMPEFHWKYGYMFVIILSLSVLFFCLWLFKKKKLW